MIQVAAFAVTLFLFAGIIGWLCYRSSAFNAVDIIYYPLAAIGVVLLFANNAAQRRLLELNQLADLKKTELRQIAEARPDVRILTSDELITTSLKSIEMISEWQSLCKQGTYDPRCRAAEKLFEPISAFLEAAKRDYPSQEEKLYAICTEADRLLDDISRNERLSKRFSDNLITQYKLLISKNYRVYDYEAIASTINAFAAKELAYTENIYRQAFAEETDSTKFVLDKMKAEADFSTAILRGLFPCITAPSKQLALLSQWNATKLSQEEEVRRIDSERQHLKEVPITPWEVQKWHLKLWPFVLICALSLKFAKGIATLRRDSISPTSDKVTPQEHHSVEEPAEDAVQPESAKAPTATTDAHRENDPS